MPNRLGRYVRMERHAVLWDAKDVGLAAHRCISEREPGLASFIVTAFRLGRPIGDLCEMKWDDDYDGHAFRFYESKTGMNNIIPAGKYLRRILLKFRTSSPYLFTTHLQSVDGSIPVAFSREALSRKFARIAAGTPEFNGRRMVLQDLRRSCVAQCARDGLSATDIAAITGHSLRAVLRVVGTLYFPRHTEAGQPARHNWAEADELKEPDPRETFTVSLQGLDLEPTAMEAKLLELAPLLEGDFVCAMTQQGRQANLYFDTDGPLYSLDLELPEARAARARTVERVQTFFGVSGGACVSGWTAQTFRDFPFAWAVDCAAGTVLRFHPSGATQQGGARWAMSVETDLGERVDRECTSVGVALRVAADLQRTYGVARLELHRIL